MSDLSPSSRPHLYSFSVYNPGKPVAEVKREFGLDNVLKLASNENLLGASPLARKAILASLDDIASYPDNGCHDLKHELAGKLGVGVDHIVIGNGTVELIYNLCQTYLEPNDEVLTGQPSFSAYYIAARIQNAAVVRIPLANHAFDLESMVPALSARTRLVFLANPNNPTGTIRGTDEIRSFIRQVPTDTLVVLDEAYYEFVTDPRYQGSLALLDEFPNLIILRSLSKTIGIAGLRVGFGIAHPAIVAALTQVQVPFHVNLLAQRAAAAAIHDRDFIDRTLAMLAEGKTYLYAELERLGLEYVRTEANFVYVNVRRSAQEVFGRLLTHGVIVRSCESFGSPTCLRVTIGLPEHNARFVRALERVL
jgi:histidinol-phosphate aminotransferase